MSGYRVRREPAAKEGWRKREARGNTPRTILGKGLFWATGGCEAKPGKQTSATKAEEEPWASAAGLDAFLPKRARPQPGGTGAAAQHTAPWLLSVG